VADAQSEATQWLLVRGCPANHTRHEAMTPDMIRQLPAGYALIIRGGYAPVIARLGAAWKDPLYKAARRRGAAIARLAPAPAAPGEIRDAGTGRGHPPRLTIVPDSEEETGPDEPGDSAYPWS
jgi:hypothetical protein